MASNPDSDVDMVDVSDPNSDVEMIDAPPMVHTKPPTQFMDMPHEIHEMILEYIMGNFATTFKTKEPAKNPAESWVLARRFLGPRYFSKLALISRLWRDMIQSRLYRHILLFATNSAFTRAAAWFSAHRHLALYVRHIDIIVPCIKATICGHTTMNTPHPIQEFINKARALPVSRRAGMRGFLLGDRNPPPQHQYNECYMPSLSCIFRHIQLYFPAASILTLNGNMSNETGVMKHFAINPSNTLGNVHVAFLPNIQVLILRGAWNIMRTSCEWANISSALPSLKECQYIYVQPQNAMHAPIYAVLRNIPVTLRHLNIHMPYYFNPFVVTRLPPIHLCEVISIRGPQLNSLTLTGYFCESIFKPHSFNTIPLESATITSIELYLNGICAGHQKLGKIPRVIGPSFWNWKYILLFERIILGALSWLGKYRSVQSIRIYTIDPTLPYQNITPYFEFENGIVRGLWSNKILRKLKVARPGAKYLKYEDGAKVVFNSKGDAVEVELPAWRPMGIFIDVYAFMAGLDLKEAKFEDQ